MERNYSVCRAWLKCGKDYRSSQTFLKLKVACGPKLISNLGVITMFFCPLQPVPPSPGAARKISFNGLKETIVLPQQAGKFSANGNVQ